MGDEIGNATRLLFERNGNRRGIQDRDSSVIPPLWRHLVMLLCLVSILGIAGCENDDDSTGCVRNLSGDCANAKDAQDVIDVIGKAREALETEDDAGAYRRQILEQFEPGSDLRVPSGLTDDLNRVATRSSSADDLSRFLARLCRALPVC